MISSNTVKCNVCKNEIISSFKNPSYDRCNNSEYSFEIDKPDEM